MTCINQCFSNKCRATYHKIIRSFRLFSIFSLLLILLFPAVVIANYWTIDYAPIAVGVVKGDGADDIAAVLTEINCPFTIIDPSSLPNLDTVMPDLQVLFVEGSDTFFSGTQSGYGEKIAGILNFVHRGGQLFVTGKADMLISTIGVRAGVKMYKPTRPGESLVQPSLSPLPISVSANTYGDLKTHLGLSQINVAYPWYRNEHSALSLESVTSIGSTTELTAPYVAQWIIVSGEFADWDMGLETLVTSFIFPVRDNGGMVHYVNYPLASAYRDSGEVGYKLATYQIGKMLARINLVSDDVFNIREGIPGTAIDKGRIVSNNDSSYEYTSGSGMFTVNLRGKQASLKMVNLSTVEHLVAKRIDNDMILSVAGTTGSVTIPGWYGDKGKLSSVELNDGTFISGDDLEKSAVVSEPDIDITPISHDKRIVPEKNQAEVDGTDGNDYIFGNNLDNTMRGFGGSNIYYYRTGDGNDTIISTREARHKNVLRFHIDITSLDVEVNRTEDDMRFNVPGGSVTVKGWYTNEAAKLDRVEIFGGTYWDIRDIEKMATGEKLLPRGLAIHPEPVENVSSSEPSNNSASGSSGGCSAAGSGWIFVALAGLASCFWRKHKKAAWHVIKGLSAVLLMITLFTHSAWAASGKYVGPTVSLGKSDLAGRRGSVTHVVITPGSADLGEFTLEEFQAGHIEPWGVNSKITGHTLTLDRIYTSYLPEEEQKVITKIETGVMLPIPVNLVVGKEKLADIHFGTSDDLEPGEYSTKVMCDITLPDELGGGVRSTYVEYTFKIVSNDVHVVALGYLIGNERQNGFDDRIIGEPITEKYLSKVKPDGDTIRKGFTADGIARLIIRLQSDEPRKINVKIPELDSLGITVESLTRKPIDLDNITLEDMQWKEGLYQASFILKAPEAWPLRDKIGPLDFSVEIYRAPGDPEPIIMRLKLHNAPVVLVHGLWANEGSFFNTDNNGSSLTDVLREANIQFWTNSYDNWRGPSEIVPLNDSNFYGRFFLSLYLRLAMDQIECARVDAAGHSMGGLMIKQFTRNKYFKTTKNYNKGAIRRIITFGTPHWGSAFASILLKDARYLRFDKFTLPVRQPGESQIVFDKRMEEYRSLHRGVDFTVWLLNNKNNANRVDTAVDDLRVGSPLIQELNNAQYDVPMHVIAGDTGDELVVEPYLTSGVNWMFEPYDHSSIFCDIDSRVLQGRTFIPENSDSVVGVSSALWTGAGFTVASHWTRFTGIKHTGMGTHPAMSDTIKWLLTGPIDNFTEPQTPIRAHYEPEITSERLMERSTHVLLKADAEEYSPLEILSLKADQGELQPGATVKFSVTADQEVQNVMLIDEDLASYTMEKMGEQYTYSLKIADHITGRRRFVAIASTENEHAVSNSFSLIVRPDISRLSMLSFANDNRVAFLEGGTFSTRVHGLFSDGKVLNLTDGSTGTIYSSSNTSVATVSEYGIVKTLKQGECAIIAKNGHFGAILYLTVTSLEDEDNSNPAIPTDPAEPPSSPPSDPEDDLADPVNPAEPDDPDGSTDIPPSPPSLPEGTFPESSGGCNGGFIIMAIPTLFFVFKVNYKVHK